MSELQKQLMKWFDDFIRGSQHTRVFLISREKMHPDGVALYDQSVETALGILMKLREHDGVMQPYIRTEVDGAIVHGSRPLSPESRDAVEEIVKAVKARYSD